MSRRGAGCGRSEAGATSIEFALIAVPLALLIGAILHVGAAIWLSAGLDAAADDAARLVRQFPGAGRAPDPEALKARVCSRASVLAQCEQRLSLRLMWFATLTQAHAAVVSEQSLAGQADPGRGDILLIEARYAWPLPGSDPPPALVIAHMSRRAEGGAMIGTTNEE